MNVLTEKLINKQDFFLEWYLIFVYDVDMFIARYLLFNVSVTVV